MASAQADIERYRYAEANSFWTCSFMAVSIFNNAGFVLWPDGLTRFVGDPWICLTIALAVVPFLAAGLGYTAATHTPSETTTVQPAKHLDNDGDGVADYAQRADQ